MTMGAAPGCHASSSRSRVCYRCCSCYTAAGTALTAAAAADAAAALGATAGGCATQVAAPGLAEREKGAAPPRQRPAAPCHKAQAGRAEATAAVAVTQVEASPSACYGAVRTHPQAAPASRPSCVAGLHATALTD